MAKKKARKPAPAASKEVLTAIKASAEDIQKKIIARKKPTMRFPVRSLTNVKYRPDRGFFEIAGRKKERTLTVNTVKTFAQTLRMIALSKELLENDDIATKREAYYVSKNWEEARFNEQPESDTVMDDVEAFFSVNREQLGFIPEEKGGDVAGRLIVVDHDRDTGKVLRIDCTKFGSGAYSIPISVEHLQFETNADFILVIETAGMFQRLVKHNYWKKADCILVSMGGGSDTGMPPFHPAPCGLQEDSCVCFRRRRPLRHHQHLPDAQGGVGECRASERVLLRPPGALPRHHAPGHHRLQAAHAPAERGRCQEGARCREKRPVHPAS